MGFLLHGGPHLASTCPKRKHIPLKVAAAHAGIGELEDCLVEIEEEKDVEEPEESYSTERAVAARASSKSMPISFTDKGLFMNANLM